jgi:hypothetical protein
MPRIKYVEKKFSPAHKSVIDQANGIIRSYQRAGYKLTLRQLYYQFVSRDLIANKVQEYKRLGGIINNARLAGLIDWNAIEDRTRNLHSLSHWNDPSEIISDDADVFKIDMWEGQEYRVEVWIEKEALAGVFQRVCDHLRVPFFSCRGYTSQSEMWSAAQRLKAFAKDGQVPVILHFGDHDPSGIDMTRDIRERLELFSNDELRVDRLALNMSQIEEYDPPPNPAKETDSRFQGYLKEYGDESWELDALEPDVLATLVRDAVGDLRNDTLWAEKVEQEEKHRRLLAAVSEKWDDVCAFVEADG